MSNETTKVVSAPEHPIYKKGMKGHTCVEKPVKRHDYVTPAGIKQEASAASKLNDASVTKGELKF